MGVGNCGAEQFAPPVPLDSVPELKLAIIECRRTGIFARLEELYGSVPKTKCKRCGQCCRESPSMYSVEFAYACQGIATSDIECNQPGLVAAVLGFWWAQLVSIQYCPFLGDHTCLIYPSRPLNCRTFGLRSAASDQTARDKARQAMKVLSSFYASEGVVLPPEVLGLRVPRCRHVTVTGGTVGVANTAALHRAVVELELRLLDPPTVTEGLTCMSFDAHLALALIGRQTFRSTKTDAMKLYQSGWDAGAVTAFVMKGIKFRFADLVTPA
jgi:hypothetical protein